KPAEVKTEALQIQLEPAGGLARLHEFVGDKAYAIYFDSAPVAEQAARDLFSATEKKPDRVAYIAKGTEVRRATEAEGMSLFLEKPGQAVGHDLKLLYRQI